MNRRRIALVVDHFLPTIGGIELHVADLARRLSARGHEVTVITTTPSRSAIEDINVCRLPVRFVPGAHTVLHPGPLLRLRKMFREGRFDVVHCHASVASPLVYGAAGLAGRMRLPCVMTVHSYWKLCARFLRGLARVWPWNHVACQLSGVSPYIAGAVAWAARRNDVHFLPNGIDGRLWRIDREPRQELRVTTVMRLHVKKRPQQLLRAVAAVLRERNGEPNLRFTLVGDGPERRKLELEAKELGIADRVEFPGFLSRDGIRQVFRRTDIFALPTRYEAFGIAALEASCAGLPVLAMKHCGVSAIVQHGENGLLAEDDREFASYLGQLVDDHALRQRLAAAPREHLASFEWPAVLEKHEQVYEAARAAANAA